jgi:hypothetical protein
MQVRRGGKWQVVQQLPLDAERRSQNARIAGPSALLAAEWSNHTSVALEATARVDAKDEHYISRCRKCCCQLALVVRLRGPDAVSDALRDVGVVVRLDNIEDSFRRE